MAQTSTPSSSHSISWTRLLLIGGAIALAAVAFATQSQWLPAVQQFATSWNPPPAKDSEKQGSADAGHAAHDNPNSIELSPQARKNIGLTEDMVQPVKLQPFTRSISVPGMVVERPGRSVIEVTAPFTGHIVRIYAIEGESLDPGAKLFGLRLRHEDLVQTQADLLQSAADLAVIEKEIARLETLAADGLIAGKRLIEQKYERDKKQAIHRARRQALLLHGLSEAQIANIVTKRELFKDLTITVDELAEMKDASEEAALFQVQDIKVAQGQQVEAGTTLAVLADHSLLYIEGAAFERDIADVSRVAENKMPVTAVLETDSGRSVVIEDLRILYLASKIDPVKRTLDFYVTLPNAEQRDTNSPDGRRFFAWKYRPGQRVQLEIPLEMLPDRIILPIDAIAQDGTETYVFTPNGDQWERRSVHVEYRDSRQAVIASDGSLFPGERVALTGAQQLQLAIKNKSGGAIDPHAGHSH